MSQSTSLFFLFFFSFLTFRSSVSLLVSLSFSLSLCFLFFLSLSFYVFLAASVYVYWSFNLSLFTPSPFHISLLFLPPFPPLVPSLPFLFNTYSKMCLSFVPVFFSFCFALSLSYFFLSRTHFLHLFVLDIRLCVTYAYLAPSLLLSTFSSVYAISVFPISFFCLIFLFNRLSFPSFLHSLLQGLSLWLFLHFSFSSSSLSLSPFLYLSLSQASVYLFDNLHMFSLFSFLPPTPYLCISVYEFLSFTLNF